MKIQCITANRDRFKHELITNSTFASPNTLDSYDINIIDLSSEYIWCNNGLSYNDININRDLSNLSIMINNSSRTSFVFLYPQNFNFKYCLSNNSFLYRNELKNMLNEVSKILHDSLKMPNLPLQFQNNKTNVNDILIDSSFHFTSNSSFDSILKANDSNLIVAKRNGNKIYTTLNLIDANTLLTFLTNVGLYKSTTEPPKWVQDIHILNEVEIIDDISSKKQEIDRLKSIITINKEKLKNISEYKTVLYESGTNLENIVKKMLSNMTGYDLSDFIDNKREDFLIKLDCITFIGEIKGKDTNVKDSFLSQLFTNYNLYKEELENSNINENVKQILIINYENKKPVNERNDINQRQIEMALKNNQLIIDTFSFLKLYELFLLEKINSELIIKYLSDKTGLFDISEIYP